MHADPALGLSEGAQWRQATLRVAQLARNGKPNLATCLEMHMCKTIWTPARLLGLGYTYTEEDTPLTLCNLCGCATDSVEHRTYHCQETQNALALGEDKNSTCPPRIKLYWR